MLNKSLPYGFKGDEVEVEGAYCPKCGAFLECDFVYEYLVPSCANCGFQFKRTEGFSKFVRSL